mmetsp:Transcript_9111/g.14485  ORF Transcript_9111/g.14485 Transcript_9111/m.14485 type:complete len:88 (+) Transcript_9111:382-645(+)
MYAMLCAAIPPGAPADLHMRVCCSKLMMFSVRVDLLNIALFTHPASLTFLCLYALVLCAPLQAATAAVPRISGQQIVQRSTSANVIA